MTSPIKRECVECGRPGYIRLIGSLPINGGHVDQRIRHPFRTELYNARERLTKALAAAMLDAKAGADGARTTAEQLHRTQHMADWVIARLPFHGVALTEHNDGLSDDVRQADYRAWLRASNAKMDAEKGDIG